MTHRIQHEKDLVTKRLLVLSVIISLAVGFVAGIIFTGFKLNSGVPFGTPPGPIAQSPETQAPNHEDMFRMAESETRKNPRNHNAWTQLGNLYYDVNQYDKAVDAYLKSIELKPDNPDVLTDLGVMYRRSGRPGKAVEAFDRAIKSDPVHEAALVNKGIVQLHDLNDVNGAARTWEQVLAINPVAMGPGGKSIDEMVEALKQNMNE